MKKLVVLPALALAAVFAAHPACAASSNKKPATAAAAPTTPSPGWAQIPPGKPHKLRKNVPISSQDKANWKSTNAATLKRGSYDPKCKWDRPTPDLAGATFLINESGGALGLQVIYKTSGKNVTRTLDEGLYQGDLTWLSSTPKDDWNYFVMIVDKHAGKPTMDKWFEVELFPPKGYSAICDAERPDAPGSIAQVDDKRRGLPCEAGTGSGGEPGGNH